MKYSKLFLLVLAVAAFAVSCRKDKEENPLSYYVTPYPYDIVNVQEPPVTNEVRNVIFLIGDGMGLEQVSCAWA